MQPEVNGEAYDISQHEDDGADRLIYWVEECPAGKKNCSWQSWKKHNVWSLQSEHQCRKYLMRHLTISGHHQMDMEEAETMCMVSAVESVVETFQDREDQVQIQAGQGSK